MTSAQVVETSVTVTDNSPFQDYPHPDDHNTRSTVTPGFKPFTVVKPVLSGPHSNGTQASIGFDFFLLILSVYEPVSSAHLNDFYHAFGSHGVFV